MRDSIIRMTEETIKEAEKLFNRTFDRIPLKFDLKGKTAGQCCYDQKTYFRFNLPMAELNKDNFVNTVIHEVGHYIADVLYDRHNIKPHGKEWKRVVSRLGGEQKRCHNYTLPETRTMRMFEYKCLCADVHKISAITHNKILKGQSRYCKVCKCVIFR